MVFLVKIGFNRNAVGRRGAPWVAVGRRGPWEIGLESRNLGNNSSEPQIEEPREETEERRGPETT